MKSNIFFNTYKNKKIIVTGHTGFKGSWLSLWLTLLGANVVGLSNNIVTKPSFFEANFIKKIIKDIRIDLRDLKKLKKIFIKVQPDFVFHLAAQSLVKKSYEEPLNTFSTNIIGTLHVLECLRLLKKKCVSVIITSDKSYKNLEISRGYKENDLLGGTDPYSASKGSAEFIIQSYVNSFLNVKKGKLVAVARAGNVIGGGDWSSDRIMPDCIKAWSKKKTVKIRNPNSTRPWQHVLEAIRGYLVLGIKLNKNKNLHGEAFNFGPKNSQNKNVIQLVKESRKIWPAIKWNIEKKQSKNLESKLLKLNSNKAEKKLNWKPILNFNNTIEMVINWYKTYYFKKKYIYKFSKSQILNYMSQLENR
jgi:CDP-glucose 4,6-dehydratase